MIKFGGNTTCVEVDFGNRVLIIDAGTGIRRLGEELNRRKQTGIDMIITHSHWDHIQGMPFFLPMYSKNTVINIAGCTGSYKNLKDILAGQMSSEYFPVSFADLHAKISFGDICNSVTDIAGHTVRTIKTNHPMATYGVRVEGEKSVFVFITDNELNAKEPVTTFDEFVEFCKGADLLIHDAQFTDEEYTKRQGWGHSTFNKTFELGMRSNVKQLGFFHHDPSREDKELDIIEKQFRKLGKQKGSKMKVFAVKEMSEFKLG
jgi:phosphoribosyl 1,2-cyclic phosphodiesterase